MPPPFLTRLRLADEAATERLGHALAGLLRAGDLVALGGELGVGKTRLARAVIGSLAGAPEEVPSPTFTLAQTYDTPRGTVWHFDLYRLRGVEEVIELGFEEAASTGICLVEWPDRLEGRLPEDRLEITLDFAGRVAPPEARLADIAGHGVWAARAPALAAAVARAEPAHA